MNAKQTIAKLDGYGGIIPFNSEELEVTLRALRLLAVIEGAEGETPETDALVKKLETEIHANNTNNVPMQDPASQAIDTLADMERERNAALPELVEAQSVIAGTDSVAEKVDELNNDLALIRKIISDQADMITERERELAEARRALVDALLQYAHVSPHAVAA